MEAWAVETEEGGLEAVSEDVAGAVLGRALESIIVSRII